MKNSKNIIITILFSAILIVIFIVNLVVEDKNISLSERRKLTQFPELKWETIADGSFSKKFEEYTSDQFAQRDFFRKIKSFWSINFYGRLDDNGYFEKDSAIYKMEYPLKESNVKRNTDIINNIYNKYLSELDVYYSIIPEKNYYLKDDDHLLMNYSKIEEIMNNNLKDMTYINIFDSLNIDDYYKTDIHWKQENLDQVVKKINRAMGIENVSHDYKKEHVGEFFGTYYGQIPGDIKPDEMYIMTSDTLKKCTTYNYETNKENKVYDMTNTNDKYDIYLSGATPLIRIDNPVSKTNKELIMFRDSFGSSLAPLLVENYKTITLVDLRYINSSILDKYINFENQDVLFIYNSLILNQNVLK